jgi:hypothetical protein
MVSRAALIPMVGSAAEAGEIPKPIEATTTETAAANNRRPENATFKRVPFSLLTLPGHQEGVRATRCVY